VSVSRGRDPSHPSISGLVVSDGITTVSDLAALDAQHGELAYLSACSTARSGAYLPDEALHVTGAFQLAGYRHVVGTLWPVQDQVAALTAVEFYKKRPAQSGTRADWAAGALSPSCVGVAWKWDMSCRNATLGWQRCS
jgi:CHAT domain-containing protein